MKKEIEVKNTDEYLSQIKSENTKRASMVIIKKLARYIENDLNNIKTMKKFQIDMFIKKEMNGKSETTISNTVSRLKDLFAFYNNSDSVKHLNLNYVKTIVSPKKAEYYTPYEIFKIIENLINYQDKALILLSYLGFYDNDFETIRTLRKDQFTGNSIILDNGKEVKLNEYCSNIIGGAIKEETIEKYEHSKNTRGGYYELKDLGYIIKTRDRKDAPTDTVLTSTLKKRMKMLGSVVDQSDLSGIKLKNSKYLYDLVKLEYETNLGFNINQVELLNYTKENNMKGSIGKLNISKKEIKDRIIEEILTGKDIIHQ